MALLKRHPAFWIGMLMLGFCGLGLGWDPIAVIPWIGLLFFPWIKEKKWTAPLFALLLGLSSFFYTTLVAPSKQVEEEEGLGYFQISEIKEEESPFGKKMVFRGTLLHFRGESGTTSHHLPCSIYVKNPKERMRGDRDYLVEGLLSPKKHGRTIFKPKNLWKPVEGTFSFAEWRYQTKTQAKNYLRQHFPNAKVLSLFAALALGEIDDRHLADDFRNLGLSHILAISGFHFALAAAFILFALQCFLPKKLLALSVFLIVSAYAFFLGASPSILRAWAAISLFLSAKFFGYRTTGLNALGFGLILELLFDPVMAGQLGFGLSFLATAAILLLYSPCEALLCRLFIPRKLSLLEQFSFIEKHLYLLSNFLRSSLSLNFCVHLVVLPACLLFFHDFPLLGILYNLFFPFLIGLSLSLFFLSLPVDWVFPSLGAFLHHANHAFAKTLLEITAYPPLASPRLHTEIVTPVLFSLWLLLCFSWAIYFDKKRFQSL